MAATLPLEAERGAEDDKARGMQDAVVALRGVGLDQQPLLRLDPLTRRRLMLSSAVPFFGTGVRQGG